MPWRGVWLLLVVLAVGGCGADALAPEAAPAPSVISVTTVAQADAIASMIAPSGDVFDIVRAAPDEDPVLYEAEDLDHPQIVALQPLVAAIYRDYGYPATELARVRALRDWVARTAIIGMNGFHPDGSTANLSVLPPGKSWREVNRRSAIPAKIRDDATFWWSVGSDGTAMLRELVGEYQSGRWNRGMMEHVAGSRFRIRNLTTHRYALCTFQAMMAVALWNAAGFHASLVQSVDHDGAAVFVPDLGRWVWQDPTHNEDFVDAVTGSPLGTMRLQVLSARDSLAYARSVRIQGPVWDRETYVNPARYGCCTYTRLSTRALTVVAQQVRNRQAGQDGWRTATYFVSSARAGGFVPRGARPAPVRQDIFPLLGARVDSITSLGTVALAHLGSTFPETARYEMRIGAAGPWTAVSNPVALPPQACDFRFRPLDSSMRPGAAAMIRRVSPSCS